MSPVPRNTVAVNVFIIIGEMENFQPVSLIRNLKGPMTGLLITL